MITDDRSWCKSLRPQLDEHFTNGLPGLPRFEYHTLIEYVHRALAVLSGCLSLGPALVAIAMLLRRRRSAAPLPVPAAAAWLAVGLAPLFAVQGALGGWVVLGPRPPRRHGPLRRRVRRPRDDRRDHHARLPGGTARPVPGFARLAASTIAATYVLLLVGTYVRAEGAGLAFRDWPLMGGRLVPASHDRRRDRDAAASGARAPGRRARACGSRVRARTMRPRSRDPRRTSRRWRCVVLLRSLLGRRSTSPPSSRPPRRLVTWRSPRR